MKYSNRTRRKKIMLYRIYIKGLAISFVLAVSGTSLLLFSGSKCFSMIKEISGGITLPQFHLDNWALIVMICLIILFQFIILDFTVTFMMHIVYTVRKINKMAEGKYDPLLNRIRKDMNR